MKKILIIPLVLILNYSFSQSNGIGDINTQIIELDGPNTDFENDAIVNEDISCSKVILDKTLYQEAEEGEFDFVNIEMESECLALTIRYSGGCKEPVVKLIDAGAIKESLPIQRNLKVSFIVNDNCEALITKKFYFDLSNLKVERYRMINLNIKNWKKRILLEY